MKKLVIFDLDGTLLNTIADLAAAANYALQQLGYPTHPVDTIRTYVGNGINKLLERSLPENERNEEKVLQMRTHFVPYYDKHKADLSCPYPGIVALLEELQHRGIMTAVASNKYQAATTELAKHYFPTIDFIEILGQREDIAVKPDPTIVYDILKKAKVLPEEVLYVGDSGVDMKTAINSGIDAIGVTWGFRPKAELESFRPKGIIDKAEELLEYL